jgi:NADH-quinone oxidoreductase subunit C
MLIEDIKKELEELKPESLERKNYSSEGCHWDITLNRDNLQDFARIMNRNKFFIEDVCGVDLKEDLQVLYHFAHTEELCRITGRIFTPRNTPEVPTISNIFPGADWHERETFDFFGICFTGHKNLKHLLLPEDADITPLRKSEAKLKSLDDLTRKPLHRTLKSKIMWPVIFENYKRKPPGDPDSFNRGPLNQNREDKKA